MMPALQIVTEQPIPKRIVPKDLTAERLDSLRESVIDFCKRSRGEFQAMHVWSYISKVIRGQENTELWWLLEGNQVRAFLVAKYYPDFEGKWVVQIVFGWSDLTNARDHLRAIIEDYFHKGIISVNFVTYRNPKVYQRWLGTDWKPYGTIFELRRPVCQVRQTR